MACAISSTRHEPGDAISSSPCIGLSSGAVFPQILHRAGRRLGHPATSACLFGGWAMTDPNFQAIITKPDNVPIVMLIYSVGFTTWLALRKAVINDDRIARGEPPLEKLEDEKVLVWPDLVYTELIAHGGRARFVLMVWAVLLKAPLEQPAVALADSQSVEGAVVLPRLAGNARLLRSVDGRRGAADHDHRRPDRPAVHRFQPEGQRLLHLRPAQVRHHDLPVRLRGAVGDADRAGHVPARAELELFGPFEPGTRTRTCR